MATREELNVERGVLVTARLALLNGEMVKEWWRDGRRQVFNGITVDELDSAIADVDDKLLALDVADRLARPRFRALSVRFPGRC